VPKRTEVRDWIIRLLDLGYKSKIDIEKRLRAIFHVSLVEQEQRAGKSPTSRVLLYHEPMDAVGKRSRNAERPRLGLVGRCGRTRRSSLALPAACIRPTGSVAAFTMSRLVNPADKRIRRNTPSAIPTYASWNKWALESNRGVINMGDYE
jgi:hypothetical protein